MHTYIENTCRLIIINQFWSWHSCRQNVGKLYFPAVNCITRTFQSGCRLIKFLGKKKNNIITRNNRNFSCFKSSNWIFCQNCAWNIVNCFRRIYESFIRHVHVCMYGKIWCQENDFSKETNWSDEKAVVPNGMLKRTVTMDMTINFGLLPSWW